MAHESYKDASRRNWGEEAGLGLTLEEINTGAMLRIADATEKMAEQHTELIRQRDYFEGEVQRLLATCEHLERSNASLRGHLKRAKKRMSNVRDPLAGLGLNSGATGMPMLSIEEVAEFSELAKKQLADLKRENDHMRAAIANGPGPCAYCGLTREQWSQCKSGFPGCARGDDAMLCPNVGALLEADEKLDRLLVQATREIAPGWVGIPSVEWDSIMGPNAKVSGGRRPFA